jgi:hypothetical protein
MEVMSPTVTPTSRRGTVTPPRRSAPPTPYSVTRLYPDISSFMNSEPGTGRKAQEETSLPPRGETVADIFTQDLQQTETRPVTPERISIQPPERSYIANQSLPPSTLRPERISESTPFGPQKDEEDFNAYYDDDSLILKSQSKGQEELHTQINSLIGENMVRPDNTPRVVNNTETNNSPMHTNHSSSSSSNSSSLKTEREEYKELLTN